MSLLSEAGGPVRASAGLSVETEAFDTKVFDTVVFGAGTQIEPARAGVCLQQGQPPYCYTSYDGDFGLTGGAAEGGYLARTRFWTDALRR